LRKSSNIDSDDAWIFNEEFGMNGEITESKLWDDYWDETEEQE